MKCVLFAVFQPILFYVSKSTKRRQV